MKAEIETPPDITSNLPSPFWRVEFFHKHNDLLDTTVLVEAPTENDAIAYANEKLWPKDQPLGDEPLRFEYLVAEQLSWSDAWDLGLWVEDDDEEMAS